MAGIAARFPDKFILLEYDMGGNCRSMQLVTHSTQTEIQGTGDPFILFSRLPLAQVRARPGPCAGTLVPHSLLALLAAFMANFCSG